MDGVVAVAGALSDASRVRALAMLRAGELCVCQIIAVLGLAASTVSKHLLILKQAGLVESRREGRWMHYRLADKPSPTAADALAWLERSIRGDARIVADGKALKAITRMDPEELCCRLRCNDTSVCAPGASAGRTAGRAEGAARRRAARAKQMSA